MMLRNIKQATGAMISAAGLIPIISSLYRTTYPLPTRVLYSHQVVARSDGLAEFLQMLGHFSVEELETRISYLKKHYVFVTLDEYVSLFRERRKPSFPSLSLTFDDGHRNLYTNVYPLLKKYSIPATIFLTTGCVENHTVLSQDQLIYMFGKTKIDSFTHPALFNKTYFLRNENERLATFRDINAQLKKMFHKDRLQAIEQLQAILNTDLRDIHETIRMLSWSEIKEMYESRLVSFGAHTVSHPILTRIPPEKTRYEIEIPKLQIEQQLGEEVRFFAYPNGSISDYDESVKTMVKEAGYTLAFTTVEFTGYAYDEYEMPRYCFERGDSFNGFALKMSGFHDLMRTAKNWARREKGYR
ncbi:MAG TPA: polysaccharide deacetylase family protein [Syntrophorhabdaceae bacterium]|nr:polysaccharide deacetylase family protein [Syntrophorhabdaceae bacterium]